MANKKKPAKAAPKKHAKKAAAKAAKPAQKAPARQKPAAKSKPSSQPKPASKPAPQQSRKQPHRPFMPVRPPPAPRGAMAMTKRLTARDLAMFKDLLLKLRDRVIDEISFLSRDNLNRSQRDSSGDLSSYSFHMADQGTDNFDREFAANLLSGEQDVLYEIDEAIRRMDAGTFGICESTGQPIEFERLKVLPFARYCVSAQTEIERGKPRFRPFRRTSIQTLEAQT